jgi:hypothetical protein
VIGARLKNQVEMFVRLVLNECHSRVDAED